MIGAQAMVFGNMGNTSGTGVLFTRSPATGENKLYGEYLVNAQVLPHEPFFSVHIIVAQH
jgi:phosphoenolpyruvate synthase/pyruvate phosphate dikinase